jgi:[ribosomal protein S18]-alanine N-acetyltransferase
MELTVTAMTLADLEEVEAIERVSFITPWSRQSLIAELSLPQARIEVARWQHRLVGYYACWLVADEISLLTIAVHPDYRQRGIASRLMHHLLTVAAQQRSRLVTLEVRRGNLPAIKLYERHGFTPSYVRKGYYSDGEDALVMNLEVGPALPDDAAER